jgi:Zn-dependent peptidase ImmA (M78 family)/transcriptional regulator with XRE-family HTH domain
MSTYEESAKMFGDRLRLARKRAGLSLRGLADRLDGRVTAQALSKYEAGQMHPSSSVLMALGKELDVSLDFLMSSQVEELAGVEFRAHSGTSAAERARAEAAVIDQVERFFSIDDILGLDSEGNDLPEPRENVGSLEEVEELAIRLRDDWNLGNDPIPSMVGLLEDKGVKVIGVDIPSKVSGLTGLVKRSGERPDVSVIVVSRGHNIERRRFTLAHELAHCLIKSTADGLKHEKAMDRFAAAFLIPAEHLRAEVEGARDTIPPYRELVRLKHSYGVAAAAMIMRLRDIGVLSDATVAYVFQTYGRTWRTAEPEPIDGKGLFAHAELPMRFERLVYWALADRLISSSRAAELLQQTVSDVELAVRGPAVGDARHYQ